VGAKPQEFEFHLTNASERSVTIAEIIPDCSCIIPKNTLILSPREEGKLHFIVNIPPQPGPAFHAIVVRGKGSDLRLSLEIEVKAGAIVSPSSLSWNEASARTAVIAIKNLRPTPITAVRVAKNIPGFTTTVTEKPDSAELLLYRVEGKTPRVVLLPLAIVHDDGSTDYVGVPVIMR